MDRQIIPHGTNADMESYLNRMADNALGIPIILDSAPTTAGKQVKENQSAFDGSNLFITLQGTTYRISLTAV